MDIATIDRNFTHFSAVGTQGDRYSNIRATAKRMAHLIAQDTPTSREQSIAFTKLEEAVFWANAAIARNENRT